MRRYERQISDLRLIPSGGGRFEVVVDGELLFSKAKLRRHADPEEILNAIETRETIAH